MFNIDIQVLFIALLVMFFVGMFTRPIYDKRKMKINLEAQLSKKIRQRIAKRLKECFKDLDLTKTRFMVDGRTVKVDDDTHFYKATSVDKIIKVLNNTFSMQEKTS